MFKRKINLSDAEVQDIIALSKAGYLHKEIAVKYNISNSSVGRILRSNGIISFTNKTDLEKQKVIDLYTSGMTQKKISETLNIGETTIVKILKNANIKGRDQSHAKRTYYINENYFDSIDTPNKAYILGLLFADGSINNKNTLYISLQARDKSILEKINKELCYTKPLVFKNYHDKNTNWQNQYELRITNKK